MADDAESLNTYRIQLEQVEAALLAEPENEELLKLKADLDEVINLTKDLVEEKKESAPPEPVASSSATTEENEYAFILGTPEKVVWKVGDRCLAPWSKNGKHHEAVIDGIREGKAAVTFVGYNQKEMTPLSNLKPAPVKEKKNYLWESKSAKRAEWQAEKEKRRKKQQKKALRLKTLDDTKEAEKKSWKDFNHKAINKSYKGVKKVSSIFASPEEPVGKVGVGTCGLSGKPMTKVTHLEKHWKGGAGSHHRP